MSDQVSPAQLAFYRQAKVYAHQAIVNGVDYQDFREAINTAVIDAALEMTKGNKCKAARLLKMHRNTLTRQIKAGY